MIGLLRVSNFSAHRHRRKLKFTDNLLLALTKNGIDADFRNLPRGHFCSIFKIFVIFEIALKSPPGQILKIGVNIDLS